MPLKNQPRLTSRVDLQAGARRGGTPAGGMGDCQRDPARRRGERAPSAAGTVSYRGPTDGASGPDCCTKEQGERPPAPKSHEIPGPAWDHYCGLLPQPPRPRRHRVPPPTAEEAAARGWGDLPPPFDTLFKRASSPTLHRPSRSSAPAKVEQAVDRLLPRPAPHRGRIQRPQILNGDGLRLDTFVRWEDGTISRNPLSGPGRTSPPSSPSPGRSPGTKTTCQIRPLLGGRAPIPTASYCGPRRPPHHHRVTPAPRQQDHDRRHRPPPPLRLREGEAKGILTNSAFTIHWTSVDKWGGRGQAKPDLERLHREMLAKIQPGPRMRRGLHRAQHLQQTPKTTAPPTRAHRPLPPHRPRTSARWSSASAPGKPPHRAGRRATNASSKTLPREPRRPPARRRAHPPRGRKPSAASSPRRRHPPRARHRRKSASTANRYWAAELVPHRGKGNRILHGTTPDNPPRRPMGLHPPKAPLSGPRAYCISDTGALDADAAREHNRAPAKTSQGHQSRPRSQVRRLRNPASALPR